MNIHHYPRLTDEVLLDQVWKLVCRYNHAFIPPLSARDSSYQADLTHRKSDHEKPIQYFQALKEQSFLIATMQDQVAGFMSYKHHHICQDLRDDIETSYVTTIIVDEAYRGNGLTRLFYERLMTLSMHDTITTRTWSANDSHIHILDKLGFSEVKRLVNARGEGMDTIYFRKYIHEGDN